jgi:nitrous-oxide reductase
MNRAKDLSHPEPTPARRRFLGTAAAAGLAGVGLAACSEKPATAPAPKAAASAPALANPGEHANASHLKPGELDTYYGLWSGGHTGDLRVLGLPSGREITRIPVFVPDALVGWAPSPTAA